MTPPPYFKHNSCTVFCSKSGNYLTLPLTPHPPTTCFDSLQASNSLDRRRRRAGGAEVKEDDGMENEDGAGNPTGGTHTPNSSGVGVSTRRTTYVVVKEINLLLWFFWGFFYLY